MPIVEVTNYETQRKLNLKLVTGPVVCLGKLKLERRDFMDTLAMCDKETQPEARVFSSKRGTPMRL